MMELSEGDPVKSLARVSVAIPEVRAFLAAPSAAPRADGIEKSFAPQVESLLSVNLPPN